MMVTLSISRFLRAVALLLTLLASVSLVAPAEAQIVVTDPGNTAQNLMTAIRTLQSNVNEAQMIAYQLQNLQSLNLTQTPAYTSQYQQFLSQINNVQGALGSTINIQRTFQSQYPTLGNTPTFSSASTLSTLTGWQTNLSSTIGDAVGTSSSVVQSVPVTQANMNNILTASNNSQGMLQATQASNQMVAVVSNQLGQMNTQLATYETAQMESIKQQQAQKAEMDAATDYVSSGYTSVGARTPINIPGNR